MRQALQGKYTELAREAEKHTEKEMSASRKTAGRITQQVPRCRQVKLKGAEAKKIQEGTLY